VEHPERQTKRMMQIPMAPCPILRTVLMLSLSDARNPEVRNGER
jgi:hypothetical protein